MGKSTNKIGKKQAMTTGFEILIQNLESDNDKVRKEAVLALSYDGAKAVPALIQAVRNNTVSVKAVIEVFHKIGKSSIDPLTDMLHSDNNEYQRKAAHILAAVGDSRALVQLIITLDDEDPLVRAEVAAALGEFKDERIIGPLLKAMQDQVAQVRANATLSLGNLQDRKITDALLMTLEDAEPIVRRSAIRALADNPADYIVPALTQATRDSDESVRQTAAAALQYRKGDAVAFERLNLEGDISNELHNAIEKVMSDGKLDTRDMQALRHSNPRVRSELLSYIAEKSGPQMVKLVLPALNDINPAVRAKAIYSLTNLSKKGVDQLIELLPQQTSPYTRAGIAEVLGNIGDQRALVSLMRLLVDEDERVITSAVTSLSQLNNPDAIDPLAQLLKHPEESVRTHVTVALQKMGYDPRNEDSGVRKLFRLFFRDKDEKDL
jgi:HEAT repeat protein